MKKNFHAANVANEKGFDEFMTRKHHQPCTRILTLDHPTNKTLKPNSQMNITFSLIHPPPKTKDTQFFFLPCLIFCVKSVGILSLVPFLSVSFIFLVFDRR